MKTLSNILLTLSAIVLCQQASAQISFSHAVGISYFVAGDAMSPAFNYSPRLNVVEMGDATISIGTHLNGWIVFNSRTPSSNALVLDAPLLAELNLGHAAHPDAYSDFGGFIGVGYGVSLVGGGNGANAAMGPVANIGVRMYVSDQPCGLRLSYLYSTNDEGADVFGISLFYTLGDF